MYIGNQNFYIFMGKLTIKLWNYVKLCTER